MSLVGNKNLPADMIAEIVERTDGIPLFVEEMTKAVLEAESESVARRTVAAAPSAALAVPASLDASLMARLGPAQPGQGGGADRRSDEGAAKAESQSPGTGVAGASSQLLAGSPRAQQPAGTESRTAAVQTVIVPVGSVSAVACWPLNSKPS